MRVLIANTDKVECGVGQFGKRVYNLASKSDKVEYFYQSIPTRESFETALNIVKPSYTVINYHWDRTPWLTIDDLKKYSNIKHYFIWHDGSMIEYYDKYLFFGYDFIEVPNVIPEDKRVILPRPLFEYTGDYPKNDIVTIGSFGFCSPYKQFPELVKLVNNTFEEAIINLHITRPWFGDNHGYNLNSIIIPCRQNNTNPKVKLNITSTFLNDEEILKFLAGNDINVLNYSQTPNPGLSSSPDYLLSVKRPMAVTSVDLLRHVTNKDNTIENNTIQEILSKGLEPLKQYYERWSIENYVSELDNLILGSQ